MKILASESKPFQSRSKGEIPGRARRKERLSRSKLKQAFLTDSDAERSMHLIQFIRFGSWKVRRLNRALGLFADGKTDYPTILYSSTSEIPTSFPGSLSGLWNPNPFIYQKPGKGTPFGRSIPV